MICDFCEMGEATRTYQSAPITLFHSTGFANISLGAWHACAECATLVDSARWADLAERVLAAFEKECIIVDRSYRVYLAHVLVRTYEDFDRQRRLIQ